MIKQLNKLLFVLWAMVGYAVLTFGPDRFQYACVLFCLLCEIGMDVWKNNKNDRGKIA